MTCCERKYCNESLIGKKICVFIYKINERIDKLQGQDVLSIWILFFSITPVKLVDWFRLGHQVIKSFTPSESQSKKILYLIDGFICPIRFIKPV